MDSTLLLSHLESTSGSTDLRQSHSTPSRDAREVARSYVGISRDILNTHAPLESVHGRAPSRTAAVARPVLKDAHVSQEEGIDCPQVHGCGRAGRCHHRVRPVIRCSNGDRFARAPVDLDPGHRLRQVRDEVQI
ncbi:hypothetical protein ARTHRO9V_1680002 [Arthrobacter sp. 9V]|nr:hypothetical protein CURTO8I2_200051 [Curtobacterium sp. 8I-2]VXB67843.1 hypothetical protein ARTHRO9V_1680002 [Arthrobacter sp. 9V]